MRPMKDLFGGMALSAILVVGCGSGSGAPSDPLRPYDPAQPSNDYPSGASQTSQGSPAPGGIGCPVCRTYSCVVGGQSGTLTLSATGGGGCSTISNGAPVTLACGGSRWKQTGSHIVFDCNGFTIYDVEMDGDRLIGRWYRNPKASDERTRTQGAATCLQLVPR